MMYVETRTGLFISEDGRKTLQVSTENSLYEEVLAAVKENRTYNEILNIFRKSNSLSESVLETDKSSIIIGLSENGNQLVTMNPRVNYDELNYIYNFFSSNLLNQGRFSDKDNEKLENLKKRKLVKISFEFE